LGEQYQNFGHEVFFFSVSDAPKLGGYLQRILFPEVVMAHINSLCSNQGLDVVDGSLGDIWVWAKLARTLRRQRPLLVTRSHGLHHLTHEWILQEARRGALKLSWMYSLYRGGFNLWEIRNAVKDSDLVFLLNKEERDYVIKQLGVESARAHIFPNGIPESFLSLPFEPLPTEPDTILRIAQVSSYIPRKGIQYGSPALQTILKRYPNVEVSFIGAACSDIAEPESAIYADFDPAFHHRIKVIPRYAQETLPKLLEGHHIKLLPTLSEGFGKAIVEAMACGLAPVTTNVAGPLEIVQDGRDAIVVPTRNSSAIVQALDRLIRDRAYLEKLRRNAYETAQNYGWKHTAQARLACYEEAIQKKAHFNRR
jgi:glycosyltransferase involved in cell wall biosynthesis